ncbi:hypothetical protein ACTXT7_007440 [Hymenolepis weldensis]
MARYQKLSYKMQSTLGCRDIDRGLAEEASARTLHLFATRSVTDHTFQNVLTHIAVTMNVKETIIS